ncbi:MULTISPECIES: alternate-type signal peptide domain-containing protein [unclassified Arthrobacter]|uniref:alternate-type signal peptide domain-containing protein n=2 Tax=Arthrobacter TaxID=1663 RepID=UPI001E5C0806|nr:MULTISPECIES: alternate-type signal peptide domain-containing protein [unclassified Arthrobacter]MCC9146148.1 alternate-type signal peptide domain-containing protein [Arthrobacter sp. zg-Y919]MDK1277378.1 alternate-type signal peptide domain-containing protein [Arthrobacter sp. zg.Y919]
MNKMAKGALAIGLGSAMLLGGGGTLAVWNDKATADAGIIQAGSLDVAAEPGVWTNAAGVIDIASYKVVPGEQLTFIQNVDVTLEGNQMKAQLSLDPVAANSFKGSAYPVVTYTKGGQKFDPAKDFLTTTSEITAKAVFTFNPNTTGQQDMGATLDLSKVNYILTQVAK